MHDHARPYVSGLEILLIRSILYDKQMYAEIRVLGVEHGARTQLANFLDRERSGISTISESPLLAIARRFVARIDKKHFRPLLSVASEQEYRSRVARSSKALLIDFLPVVPFSLILPKSRHPQKTSEKIRSMAKRVGIVELEKLQNIEYSVFVLEDAIEAAQQQSRKDLASLRSLSVLGWRNGINAGELVDSLYEAIFLEIFAMFVVSDWNNNSKLPMFDFICQDMPRRADSLFLQLGKYAYQSDDPVASTNE